MNYDRYEFELDDIAMEGIAPSIEGKGATSKRAGGPYTRGIATSFGFRRRPSSGIPLPIGKEDAAPGGGTMHQRSKSAGPEQERRRDDEEVRHERYHSASSGRSTPRLAPPKKEAAVASGNGLRTNRFGFRQAQAQRYTNKVGDICVGQGAVRYGQDRTKQQQQQQQQYQQYQEENETPIIGRESMRVLQTRGKPRSSPVNDSRFYADEWKEKKNNVIGAERTTIEPIGKYTLHTSHLPLPQYAMRMNEANPKVAKTVANQSRKVLTTGSKGSTSSKEGSGTEDSGIGSQQSSYMQGPPMIGRRSQIRARSLRTREYDDDNTVTEISVIALPASLTATGLVGNLNGSLVRDRTAQYQRMLNKDNRYTESTTSMSTTSSEGYDEGIGEEKANKDVSRTEKICGIELDSSPASSDDPEFGEGGEAMADEYSVSSSDDCRLDSNRPDPARRCLRSVTNAALTGSLAKSTLRSVLLTIEDPAFAAAAATTTSLIDDETSPVDSLVDSLTASFSCSDAHDSRKEKRRPGAPEKTGGEALDDDSPGTPTNASNSLSLSEGREFFDDEIADQPGLIFDETLAPKTDLPSCAENSNTLVESLPKSAALLRPQTIDNSPVRGRRISRTGSLDTLSSCESITSDDLMLDYECTEEDRSCYDRSSGRLDDGPPAIHDLDDASIKQVMRDWRTTLMATTHNHSNSNSNFINNNVVTSTPSTNNNNTTNAEFGIGNGRASRLLRNRAGTDSPRSLDSVPTRRVSSPFGPVFPPNVPSPSLDSGDEGSIRSERFSHRQDIVAIKTGLLKLMRVLQEAESLTPFNTCTVNGLFNNLNQDGNAINGTNGRLNVADEFADLERQVVYLQGQLEDKDRRIQQLEMQISRRRDASVADSRGDFGTPSRRETRNATTQTEKIRPVSAGPLLLQSLPQEGGMGPLVSRWSDSWNRRKPSTPSLADTDANKKLRKPCLRDPSARSDDSKTTKTMQNGSTAATAANKSLRLNQLSGSRNLESSSAKSSLLPKLSKLSKKN